MAKGIGDAISALKANLAAMLSNVDDLQDSWDNLASALGGVSGGGKSKAAPKAAKKGAGKRRPKRDPADIKKAIEEGAKKIAATLKGAGKEGMSASELAKAAKVSDLDFLPAVEKAIKAHSVKRTGKRGGTKYHHG